MDQKRRAPDVAHVERSEVERHDDEAVVDEPALEHVHRAAGPEEPVDHEHGRRLGGELAERGPAADPVAAHEVTEVGQPVGAPGDVLADRAALAEPAPRRLERPPLEPRPTSVSYTHLRAHE